MAALCCAAGAWSRETPTTARERGGPGAPAGHPCAQRREDPAAACSSPARARRVDREKHHRATAGSHPTAKGKSIHKPRTSLSRVLPALPVSKRRRISTSTNSRRQSVLSSVSIACRVIFSSVGTKLSYSATWREEWGDGSSGRTAEVGDGSSGGTAAVSCIHHSIVGIAAGTAEGLRNAPLAGVL